MSEEKKDDLIGGVSRDYIIERAHEMLRPKTEEELRTIYKEPKYPGLSPRMKENTRREIQELMNRSNAGTPRRRFFGIKIGWWWE
ncbi:MAG: hypothetical protein ACQEUT_18285 [Bacillota bacterium]